MVSASTLVLLRLGEKLIPEPGLISVMPEVFIRTGVRSVVSVSAEERLLLGTAEAAEESVVLAVEGSREDGALISLPAEEDFVR